MWNLCLYNRLSNRGSPRSFAMSALSVSKRHVICSEILSVTSVMRKNSRWSSGAQTHLQVTKDDNLAASLGLRRSGSNADSSNGVARREVQLMLGFLELDREVKGLDSELRVLLLPAAERLNKPAGFLT